MATTHACGKVRQSSSERRRRLARVQTSRANLTQHLHRGEAKGGSEAGAVADEGSAKREGTIRGGLVGDVDDHRKVLGHEEGRHVLLDEVETLLEPGGGLGEARQDVQLPVGGADCQPMHSRPKDRATHFSRRDTT